MRPQARAKLALWLGFFILSIMTTGSLSVGVIFPGIVAASDSLAEQVVTIIIGAFIILMTSLAFAVYIPSIRRSLEFLRRFG